MINWQYAFIVPSHVEYSISCLGWNQIKQAGADLGQAQLKLELGFTLTNLHQIDEQESLIVIY